MWIKFQQILPVSMSAVPRESFINTAGLLRFCLQIQIKATATTEAFPRVLKRDIVQRMMIVSKK